MKWVTRDHVHMDRVACPWLIRRFIDPQAEFVFVPFGQDVTLPEGAIPFALPKLAELGAHDATGSTFRKILVKYQITDPALDMLAEIIESGITHVFSQLERGFTDVAALKYPEGMGLDALSQGMMYLCDGDVDDIDRSMVIYDAYYTFCRAKLLEASRPDIVALPFPQRWDAIKSALRAK
jgi:hypothetical protein